jgi:hypothetical protein
MRKCALISVLVTGLALMSAGSMAHQPGDEFGDWYRSLKVPGTEGMVFGSTSCCTPEKDCQATNYETDGGHYWIKVEGERIQVPPDKILQRTDNPTGRAVACLSSRALLRQTSRILKVLFPLDAPQPCAGLARCGLKTTKIRQQRPMVVPDLTCHRMTKVHRVSVKSVSSESKTVPYGVRFDHPRGYESRRILRLRLCTRGLKAPEETAMCARC